MNDSPASEAPPRGKKTLLIAGSVVGVGVLLCGGGGLLLAAAAGAWWYASQPVSLSFSQERWLVTDPRALALPQPLLSPRMGEPVVTKEGLVWTVAPASLGAINGGTFVAEEPGTGEIRACVEDLCATLALDVQLANAILLDPPKAEARVWTPRSFKATATFDRKEVTVPLTWASSDETVLKVDQQGVVTPVAPGLAEVLVSGGGADVSAMFRVWPEPPKDCTLALYAETVGRKGQKEETRACLPNAPDMCEWTATQALAEGGRIDEGGGWEWGWTTLTLPGADLDQIWAVAQRCMELPPEIAALPIPALLRERGTGRQAVPLGGAWDRVPAEAILEASPGKLTIDLPVACSSTREIALERGWIRLQVSEGC